MDIEEVRKKVKDRSLEYRITYTYWRHGRGVDLHKQTGCLESPTYEICGPVRRVQRHSCAAGGAIVYTRKHEVGVGRILDIRPVDAPKPTVEEVVGQMAALPGPDVPF